MTTRSLLYQLARWLGDLNAVNRSIRTGSPAPILKRAVNRWVGRKVVRKMWLR